MIYRRVLKYYRGFLTRSLIALGFSFAAIGLNLLKPWPFKIIVDQILPGRVKVFQYTFRLFGGAEIRIPTLDTTRAIALLCLAMIVIQLLWSLLSLASNYMFVKIGLQSLLRLRTELYTHLQRLSLKFHDTRRSADSSFRVAYDSQSVQTIYNKGFTNIIGSAVTLLGTFAVMLRLDWQLTLLSLAIVPLLIGTIYFFAKRIRTQSTTIQEQDSALLTQTQEGLSSIRMVHAFGREEFEVSQFQEQAHGSLQANLRLTMTNVKSGLVISTLIAGACGRGAHNADDPPRQVVVWRTVGSWSGRGNSQTESFTSDSGALRIRWTTTHQKPGGPADFRVTAHSAISGRLLQEAVDHRGTGSGVAAEARRPSSKSPRQRRQ